MEDHDLHRYTEATTKFALQLQQTATALGTVAQEIKEIRSILYENQKVRLENVQKILDNQRTICGANVENIENSLKEAVKVAENVAGCNKNEYLKDIKKNTTWTKWVISSLGLLILLFKLYSEFSSSPQDAQLHNIAHQLERISTQMKITTASP